MAEMKKVRIMVRVGNPSSGAILAPGATVELPVFWADKYIANGSAELVEAKAKDPKPKTKK